MQDLFIGLMIGILWAAIVVTNSMKGMSQSEFDKCEAKLKRTEHCIVIAVPAVKP